MEAVDNLMKQAVDSGIIPGAVLLVSSESTVVFLKAYGLAHIYEKVPVTTETIFDLASLTKPLATTLAVMHLVQNRRISVEDTLGDLVPDFQGGAKARVRLRHLLYHNSGLPDYRPYYQKLSKIPMDSRRTALRQFLVAEPLIHPCGEKVLYSDLGFMILAWVVEHITGRRLDQLVADEIYRIFQDRFQDMLIPILAGFEVGHGKLNLTIPVGMTATLDTDQQMLSFAQPATIG